MMNELGFASSVLLANAPLNVATTKSADLCFALNYFSAVRTFPVRSIGELLIFKCRDIGFGENRVG